MGVVRTFVRLPVHVDIDLASLCCAPRLASRLVPASSTRLSARGGAKVEVEDAEEDEDEDEEEEGDEEVGGSTVG